ncbi:uncharacterized protein LOC131850169 [Achroia grisella]|uniref:uncharacterized protein LOC131850169 n=1 Tax=Achroia grisella TaxID=688607 RepID=UPI0027D24E68|nr:uncharacterized protein LOC131850169 [Achroia grisella]
MTDQSYKEKNKSSKDIEGEIKIDVESNNLEIVRYPKTSDDEDFEINVENNNKDVVEDKVRTGTKRQRHCDVSNSPYSPTVWVQFVGLGRDNMAPSMGTPLDYDPESRNSFVKLVFLIVLVMLLCTVGFNFFVLSSEDMRNFFKSMGIIVLIPALITMLAVNYAMVCSTCARVMPCNIVCLCIAVAAMSVISSYFTVKYDTRLVLYAVLATVCTVIVCIMLACSSFDFTKWLLYVVVIGAAVSAVIMIVSITWLVSDTYYKPLHIVILLVGTVLNVIILVMELQTILGGRAVELSEDDYALGAFLLYTSIVDLFLKMLQLAGLFDSS